MDEIVVYYMQVSTTADSLKAKFTRDGNFAMKKFCIDNKLKLNYSKKVVVAKNKDEDSTIYELYERGIKNNVDVKIINKNELKKLMIMSRLMMYHYIHQILLLLILLRFVINLNLI